jgi:type I restriction enzyme R subunit
MVNQNPEQNARDAIDRQLTASGWAIQDKSSLNLHQGEGQAVREYQTDVGPADYVLFVDGKPVGVVEAKKETLGQNITVVEEQTEDYARAKLKWVASNKPLPFLYQATGVITRFTDGRDPKPRSREVFTFHRPETLRESLLIGSSLRDRLTCIPQLNPDHLPASALGLRDCQERAITNLDDSFKRNHPRALIQMATGSGKTFTAITFIYRLLKFAKAKRILFLVDTRNLGEQAEQEFMAYLPQDDNRKFTELYTVQRLRSAYVATDSQVCISTIQRMYAILKGEELDDAAELDNPAEHRTLSKEPLPVVYNDRLPIEFFDFIVIDECHRSIYNIWRQVLEYFDAFLIGLTATPDKRTYGFFRKNVVSEYTHEQAVADGVNVGNEIYLIDTEITKQGEVLKARQLVEKREKLTRARRWEEQDEDEAYAPTQLDKTVVNPDQIRTIIRTFHDKLPEIFPERKEVPKTLIFAKTDSHADDIINIVREEFGEGNQFCKKVTYRNEEDPKNVLAQFRNEYYPRIAVTVDMIATGTDVKPIECLLFMRDVKSKNYFEQMKGRGTRTLNFDDLRKVTPSATSAKTHYVIVDAVGVTKSCKSSSPSLITKPTVSLKDLAMSVMMGSSDVDTVSTLAARLARLEKQLTPAESAKVMEKAGVTLQTLVKTLFAAIDADKVEARALEIAGLSSGGDPGDANREKAQAELVREAGKPLTGPVIELLTDIKREHEQTVDHENLDTLLHAGWDADVQTQAEAMAQDFAAYLEAHRDELEALTIYFSLPQRRREVTLRMIQDVMDRLKANAPRLAPTRVWQAFAHLENYQGGQPINELTALVALIRRVTGADTQLRPFSDTVRRNYRDWILRRNAGQPFTSSQTAWLEQIRDHVCTSLRFERDDLEYAPFDARGGLGKMYQLFGDQMDSLIDELNGALVA